MNIVADENMALVAEIFAPMGDVKCLPGRSLSRDDLIECELLLVRSVTQVNAALLDGTPVQCVGTATAGFDHLDLDYLSTRNIDVYAAPGANAASVVDYVFAGLSHLEQPLRVLLDGGRLGIVGCGQVGGRLLHRAHAMGIECAVYDPLLSDATGIPHDSFANALAADVICLHTPLTNGGDYPTFHQIGEAELDGIKEGQWLINVGRGATVDNAALNQRLSGSNPPGVVLDVWESEPDVELSLMHKASIATPHIAGHSYDARSRATRQLFQSISAGEQVSAEAVRSSSAAMQRIEVHAGSPIETLMSAVKQAYPIVEDDARMRETLTAAEDVAREFDALRRDYPRRLEFSAHKVTSSAPLFADSQRLLRAAGFELESG